MTDPRPNDPKLSPEEWERRFKARIVERLLVPVTDEERKIALAYDCDWEPWTPESAAGAAQAEWDSRNPEDHAEYFEDDPEGAADEELSCWGDGA